MRDRRDPLADDLDLLAFLCLAVFVFAVPWEQAITPLAGMLPLRWLSFAVFGAAVLRVLVLRRLRKPSTIHYLMLALAGWSATSLLWSSNPEGTIVRAGTYAQLLILVWLIWELVRDQRRIVVLLGAYVAGTIVSSLETIRNALAGVTAGEVHAGTYGSAALADQRFTAGGFNVNDLGLMLALSIPMSVYLLTRSKSNTAKLLCLLQIAASGTAVIMTASRGATITLCIALVMVPLSASFWSRRLRTLTAAVFAVGVFFAVLSVPAAVWERLGGTQQEVEQGTLSHRTTIWAAGLEVFTEHPIEGVGAAAFSQHVVSRLARPLVAHNTFVSVLVELGVIGALILLALLASLFYSAMKMPRLESRLWTVTLAAWTVGVSTGTWEYQKATWLLFGLAAAHAAANCGAQRRIHEL